MRFSVFIYFFYLFLKYDFILDLMDLIQRHMKCDGGLDFSCNLVLMSLWALVIHSLFEKRNLLPQGFFFLQCRYWSESDFTGSGVLAICTELSTHNSPSS